MTQDQYFYGSLVVAIALVIAMVGLYLHEQQAQDECRRHGGQAIMVRGNYYGGWFCQPAQGR